MFKTLLKNSALLLTAAILMFLSSAEADTVVPLPSVPDFTQSDGIQVSLGAGVELETAYDGSDEIEAELDLFGAIQLRSEDQMLFWEGYEAGWRGLVSPNLLLQLGIRYEMGRDADDSRKGYLDDLDERESDYMGVIEARYNLIGDWQTWVGGRLMVGQGDFGNLAVAAAGRRFGVVRDGTGTEIYGYLTFADSNFLNRDFGVSASEAERSGYPETDISSGYRSFGLKGINRRNIAPQMQIVSEIGFESYSCRICDSPLARLGYEFEVGVSAIYMF